MHFDGGGFACTIRPYTSNPLAFGNIKTYLVDGNYVFVFRMKKTFECAGVFLDFEFFGKLFNFYNVCHDFIHVKAIRKV